jgi:hypothetical protein
LLPGTYTLKAAAKGFAIFTQEDPQILGGQTEQLNIGLLIQMEEEKVEVSDSSTKVDIAPSNNASMVVMQGKDLEALSDDPDELQSEIQTLAGPSAGPNGGQIYIDGFTGGTLPPKPSIREIRINQNPFSAEYDRLGYGRVEILTTPGTDQFHGRASLMGNTAGFNSRNPGPGGLGPRGGGGGGGDRGGGMFGSNPSNNRYNLTLSVSARNVFNNVNLATPIGNLSSPLFGQANGLAGGPYSSSMVRRRINLQVYFNF